MDGLINNVAHSWSMVSISIPGLGLSEDSNVLKDCSAIKWNLTRKMSTNYGIGGVPRTRGFGNISYDASITLGYNTQSYLRSVSPDHTLMGLGEFDLIISWADAAVGHEWTTETVTLEGCLFTEEGMDVKQDDTNIEKEFALNPFKISVTVV